MSPFVLKGWEGRPGNKYKKVLREGRGAQFESGSPMLPWRRHGHWECGPVCHPQEATWWGQGMHNRNACEQARGSERGRGEVSSMWITHTGDFPTAKGAPRQSNPQALSVTREETMGTVASLATWEQDAGETGALCLLLPTAAQLWSPQCPWHWSQLQRGRGEKLEMVLNWKWT